MNHPLPTHFPLASSVLREQALSPEHRAAREAYRADIRARMAMHADQVNRRRAEREQQPTAVNTYA